MHDIAEFLSAHDPFSGLDEEGLERLAERAEVEFFTAGTTIFQQGEDPQTKVRVVRRGTVELVDAGRVLDLLGEGELFGHPSMLSGLPTGFEARAHEDSLVYALAAGDVKPLLTSPSSLEFVARSLLRRRKPGAVGETDVPSAETAQQRAHDLIRRPPIIVPPETPLREAAQRMNAEGASSVLVQHGNGELGIVTDGDLRSRVVAEGMSPGSPVSAAMTAPIFSVGAEQSGADVMLTMLDHDIRHVPVLTPSREVLGVVVGIDLVAAEARTPFVLRRAIAEAKDENELREAAGRLRSTVVALHRAKLAPSQISQVISVVGDALVRRMIELAIESEGPPPTEFAWLSLGSHGRREPVPSSDLDSGISWQGESEKTAGYMHTLAQQVADFVGVIGWKLDPHGVNATGKFSASSIEEWRSAIASWLSHPSDEPVLIATSILLDGRVLEGPEHLDPKPVLFEAGNRPALLRSVLRLALAQKPPTGFMRNIVVEHSGEHRGTFDIKHSGLLPVVNLARYAALKAEVTATATVERLRAGSEAGVFNPRQAQTLEEAHDLFTGLRLEHQVQQIEAGVEPNDHLDPKKLNPLSRRYLRDAFREVASVQKSLAGELTWGT